MPGRTNSTVFPVDGLGYSEAKASELIAGIYSGVKEEALLPLPGDLHEVLTGILSVDNDAPLSDFVETFGGGDIDRLRELITRLATEHLDAESRAQAIDQFNGTVRRYEKSIEKTKSWDLVGVLQAIGPFVLPGPAKYISLGTWLLRRLVAGHDLSKSDSSTFGRIVDRLNAPPTREGTEVVLVSRLKKGLAGIK